jgi:adenylate cyclase
MRWYVAGTTSLFRGEPAEAVARLREGLRHYDEGDRDAHIRGSGHDTATSIRAHLAVAEWLAGLPEQAARTSDEALGIARRVAHPFSLAQTLFFGGLLRALSRDWEAAEALAAEAREISARFGLATFAAFGTMTAGMVAVGKGDPAGGAGLIREGMASSRRTGGGFLAPIALAHLALALGTGGDAAAALEAAGEALRLARANGELCWEAEALRVAAEVGRATGAAGAPEVEAGLREAAAVARRQGARAFELRAATSLARLRRERGERLEALDILAPVHGRFTEGFDAPDLVEARLLLDEIG